MKRFGVKIYYYRYMDDMVILCADKEALHFVLDMMDVAHYLPRFPTYAPPLPPLSRERDRTVTDM